MPRFGFQFARVAAIALALVIANMTPVLPDCCVRAQAADIKGIAQYVETIKRALPPGWRVDKVQSGSTPSDWYTQDDKAGQLLVVSKTKPPADATPVKIWILPPDWIGIRKLPNQAPHFLYWEGVLGCPKYKLITTGGDYHFHNFLQDKLRPDDIRTTSIVNGGDWVSGKIFGPKLKFADETATKLVQAHCQTPAQLKEAAHSLIVLGVPAKSVFLKAAQDGSDSFFVGALGYMQGPECKAALLQILTNPRATDSARKSSIYALEHKLGTFDATMVPALVTALSLTHDDEALSTIARALGHTRCKDAGPALLTCFRSIKSDYFKLTVAQALSAVRYIEALPELQALDRRLFRDAPLPETPGPKNVTISDMPGSSPMDSAHLAVLRMVGNWGKAGHMMRIHVEAPENAVLGKSMPLVIYIENIGSQSFSSWNEPGKGLSLNGVPVFSQGFSNMYEGLTADVQPGSVFALYYDLSKDIVLPGPHVVKYSVGDAESNAAGFFVGMKEPRPTEKYRPQLDRINQMLKLAPKDAKACAKRARIYAAMKLWQKSAEDYETALGLIDAGDPNTVVWSKELALVQEQDNYHAQAGKSWANAQHAQRTIAWRQYIQSHIEDTTGYLTSQSAECLPRNYNLLAHYYLLAGQPARALVDADRAIAADPRCSNWRVARGQINNALGHYHQAIADLSELSSLPDAFNNRAYSYLMLKQYDKALADCNKAFSEAKECGYSTDVLLEIYDHRGLVYTALGRCAEAIADFTKGLALKRVGFIDEEEYAMLRARMQFHRGQAYDKKGNHDLAERDRTEAYVNGYPVEMSGRAFPLTR